MKITLIISINLFILIQCSFSQYPSNAAEKIVSKVTFDTIFYKSGAISKIIPFRYGKMDGEQKWYCENWDILQYINYKDDKRDGPWIEYYDYGYYKETGFYLNDARDSIWIENYYNKQIKSYGRYYPNINYLSVKEIDSMQYLLTLDKNWNAIDSVILTPSLLSEIRAKYGDKETSYSLGFPVQIHFKDKTWQYWDSNGKLIREELWDKGNLISATEF